MKEKLLQLGISIAMIFFGYFGIRNAKATVEQKRRGWAKLPILGKFLLRTTDPVTDATMHAGMGCMAMGIGAIILLMVVCDLLRGI